MSAKNERCLEYKTKNTFSLDIIGTLKLKAAKGSFEDFLYYVQACLRKVEGFCEWLDEYKGNEFSVCVKDESGFYLDLPLLRECYHKLRNE